MILTVQSTGRGTYRLGISLYDSRNDFNGIRGANVNLIIKGQNYNLRTTCGPPLNKGFDLYSRALSDWITNNGHDIYVNRNPTKLNFDYALNGKTHVLTFLAVVLRQPH